MDTDRTYSPRAADVTHDWHVLDANGQRLGRLAAQVARLLRGKHKPMFTPHMDVGDYVVVVNASKIEVTGKSKPGEKLYYRHSGYIGGLRSSTLQQMMARWPERVIEHAVRGMLPRNRLGRALFRKLRVYGGPSHPHSGQVKRPEGTSQDD